MLDGKAASVHSASTGEKDMLLNKTKDN